MAREGRGRSRSRRRSSRSRKTGERRAIREQRRRSLIEEIKWVLILLAIGLPLLAGLMYLLHNSFL